MAACFRQDGTQHRPGSAPGAPVPALWHEKVVIRRYEGFAAVLPVKTGKVCSSIANGLPDPVPVKSGNTRPLKPKKTCPMRQGNNPRRSRNKGGNGGGGNNNNSGGNRRQVPLRSQNFDSNGPDVRIRGNAWQVYEKYMALARDAQTSGDPVRAENLMQHAEHYMRLINLANEESNERGGRPQGGDNNFYSGDQPAATQSNYGFGGEGVEAQEGGEFTAREPRRDENRDEGYREEGRENRRREFSRDNNRDGGRDNRDRDSRDRDNREGRERDNRDRDNRDGDRDWRRERNNRRQAAESNQGGAAEPAPQAAETGEPATLFLDVSQPADAAPRTERESRQPRRRREPRQPRSSEGSEGETLDAGLQRQLGLGGGSRRREREAVDNEGGSEEVDA